MCVTISCPVVLGAHIAVQVRHIATCRRYRPYMLIRRDYLLPSTKLDVKLGHSVSNQPMVKKLMPQNLLKF